MGREVRRVPAHWQHPKDEHGHYVPLLDGNDWMRDLSGYQKNERESCPDPADYMPQWGDAERTHFQMYEDTSEGTPISPVFSNCEELAHWLADNKASAFGSMTATYEQWQNMILAGWAPAAVISFGPGGGRIQSGVSAARLDQ